MRVDADSDPISFRCSRRGASSSNGSPIAGWSSSSSRTCQWADDGLLDFIDHILDWSRDRPIYIITLARPELLDRRRDWGAGRRNFTSLVLEPLEPDQMRELLAGLVPGLPETVVERVLERAEGSRYTRSRPSACSSATAS